MNKETVFSYPQWRRTCVAKTKLLLWKLIMATNKRCITCYCFSVKINKQQTNLFHFVHKIKDDYSQSRESHGKRDEKLWIFQKSVYHICHIISINHRLFNFRTKRTKSWSLLRILDSSSSIIATNMVSAYECLQVPVLFSKRCKLRC